MVWDVLILFIGFLLAYAGWRVGLINSWRGPLAIAIAIWVTQKFYIDLGTWIVQTINFKAQWATFTAYLVLFVTIEIITEIALNLIFTWGQKKQPIFFDRIAGVSFAIIRWIVICTLPMMAMESPNKIPEPPPRNPFDAVMNPVNFGVEDSDLSYLFSIVAKRFLRTEYSHYVISNKKPSFKPHFYRHPVHHVEDSNWADIDNLF